LGGLLFPVAGLTAGTLGFIFLAITPPYHAFRVSISSHHVQDLRCQATHIGERLTDLRAYCATDTDLLPLSWTPREGGMSTRDVFVMNSTRRAATRCN